MRRLSRFGRMGMTFYSSERGLVVYSDSEIPYSEKQCIDSQFNFP